MSLPLREKDIQKQILDYLKVRRFLHWRNNVGAMSGVYKGKKRFIRFGAPGLPDIMVIIRGGRLCGIEVKGPEGEQTLAQKEFQVSLERAGGIYILAYSIDDVIRVLSHL